MATYIALELYILTCGQVGGRGGRERRREGGEERGKGREGRMGEREGGRESEGGREEDRDRGKG